MIDQNIAGGDLPQEAMQAARRAVKISLGGAPGSIYIRRAEDDALDNMVACVVAATLEEDEARAIVIGAASGAGKTTLLDRVLRDNRQLAAAKERGADLLRVQVPSPCTLAEFGRTIAVAAGYPVKAGLRASVTWDAASRAMDARGIRFLAVDETQNVTETASLSEALKIRNTFRTLLLATGKTRGLILAGQASIVDFLTADDQIERRSDFLPMHSITKSKHAALGAGVRSIAKRGELPLSEELESDLLRELVPRLAHAALNQFGTALDMARRTVEQALAADVVAGQMRPPASHLTIEHFASRYARSTGNAAFANPFIAADWSTLDCRLRHVVDTSQLTAAPNRGGSR